METSKCIKGRRSVREYKPDPIPGDVVKELIDLATQAPSSGNTQDWEFVVVKKPETKRALAEAALNQEFIAKAPVVVVVCSNLERVAASYGERGKSLYSIQNTAAAIENLMLAAWDKGIGSCFVGAFNEAKLRDILVLPTNVRALAIITLGYPERIPEKPKRMDLKDVLHFEHF